MMCLFGKKEVLQLETPADIVSEVRNILISIFHSLTIFEMEFSISNLRKFSIPPSGRFRCMILAVNRTAVG
jgi:hypothetical protein